MKIDAWHARQLKADPEYAAAAELLSAVQDIADVVVALRVRAGLSQANLASRAGVTQAAISQLERGARNPTVSTLSRVLKALLEASAPAKQPEFASQQLLPGRRIIVKAMTFATEPPSLGSTAAIGKVRTQVTADPSRGAAPRAVAGAAA